MLAEYIAHEEVPGEQASFSCVKEDQQPSISDYVRGRKDTRLDGIAAQLRRRDRLTDLVQ